VAAEAAAEQLRLLADPTRLSMLATLWSTREPVCVCDFVAAYELGQPTISHHMSKLRRAGLVEADKAGVWTYYRAVELPRLVESVLSALGAERAAPHPAR
jgi:ArsR family transcriptional regulator